MARSKSAVNSDDLDAQRIRLLFFSLLFLLNACWLYSIGHRLLLDPDTFWHIRIGKGIWDTGRFPVRDEHSHTFFGHPWFAKEWLSQVVLYLAHGVGGWNLVVALVTFVLSLTGALIYFFLSLRINNTVALVLAWFSLALSMQTFLARPHIFTFPLLVIWTEYVIRAAEQDRAPSFLLLPIIPIWANLHGTYTFGLAIAGLSFLNFVERVRFTRTSELTKWIIFLCCCVAVSLIHPYGYRPILTSFVALSTEWKLPGEWRAVDVVSEPIHELALFVLLYLLLTCGLKLRIAKALFVLVILHLFLSHIRFAYVFYLIAPLIISFEIETQFPRLSASNSVAGMDDVITLFLKRHTAVLSGAATSAYLVVTAAFLVLSNSSPREEIASRKALDFARAAGLTGHVLNSGEFGGFLIFMGIKTFIDGRTDQLFRGRFLADLWKSLEPDGDEALNRQLHDYQIGWTLLRPTDPRIDKLDRNPGWKRAYEDEAAIIHVPAHRTDASCHK